MKARRFIAGILTAVLCLSFTAGCSNGTSPDKEESKAPVKTEESTQSSIEEISGEEKESDGMHTLFIRDAGKNSKMTATFLNTASGKTEDVEMTKSEEGEDHVTFTCKGDPKLYNMVHITYGDDIVSSNLSFNRFTAGWYLKDKKLLPYAEGMDLKYDPEFDTHKFSFDGTDKSVYVWTPKGYDKNSDEKYPTIYMFDGQTVLAAGVMSASFQLYDDNTWAEFIKDKVNMENSPFLYFYAGAYAGDNGNVNEPVYNMLIEKGYPKDKLAFDKYEPGRHEPMYWRNIYSEFLQAMFEHKVEALECGVTIKYEDRTGIQDIPPEISIAPDDPGLSVKENFIYFDNSKTKWDKVFVYWWDAIPTNKISGGFYGKEWPGIELERIEGTDIYRAVMPMGPTKIVFSSGVKDEDVRKGTIAYQTDNMDYDDEKNAGQIFRIDTSVEPKPGKSNEKTKFKYSSGSWEDFEL